MARIGQLRQRITFRRPLEPGETTQDSYGQDEGNPVLVGTFWCSIEGLQGRELDAVSQRWANARYKITLRQQRNVTWTRKMHGAWDGRTLNILDVQDIGGSLRPMVVMYAEDYNG